MSNEELLSSISGLMDQKLAERLQPINGRLKKIELTLENNILPRLQNIEACYLSTYDRYKESVAGHEGMKQDISILKNVVAEHSERLDRLEKPA